MTLTDPLRPVLASGHPALLIDGSAVPRFSILPVDETNVELVLMLRAYDAAHGFTYGQHRHVCPTAAVGALLHRYFLDPEATIATLFAWVPQVSSGRTTAKPTQAHQPMSAEAAAALSANLDLI